MWRGRVQWKKNWHRLFLTEKRNKSHCSLSSIQYCNFWASKGCIESSHKKESCHITYIKKTSLLSKMNFLRQVYYNVLLQSIHTSWMFFFFIFIYFLLTYCSNPAMAFHKLGSKFRARKISGCDWMSESGVWTLQVREAGE